MLKRFLCVLMISAVLLSFAGCKAESGEKSVSSASQKTSEQQLMGGWQYEKTDKVPESARTAFDKAVKQEDGLKLVSYLGSQVVAGMNYAFLCEDAQSGELYKVVIYADLHGNATVTDKSAYENKEK